jgi:hypothetical protein
MPSIKHLTYALLTLAIACGDSSGGDSDKGATGNKGTKDASSGSPGKDGGVRSRDSGTSTSDDDGDEPGNGEAVDPSNPGNPGESPAKGDAGTGGGAAPDAGGSFVHGAGSCCAERATPGCGNADLEVCVCEKDPSCCTKAWGKQCVAIVEAKYCQPTVRDCVCGGEQGQTQCCDSQWTSFCDSVAKLKCDAVQGCF